MEVGGSQNSSYGARGRDGYGFRGPRPFRPTTVRVGEEYDVKIESMSKRGDTGVARVQGLVIFVTDTKIGDNVKIRITKVGRGYATAELANQQPVADQSRLQFSEVHSVIEEQSTEQENESKTSKPAAG